MIKSNLSQTKLLEVCRPKFSNISSSTCFNLFNLFQPLQPFSSTSSTYFTPSTIKNMSVFQRFEEIISWQESRELNKKLARLLADKKFENNFNLIDQIERSAGSIMDNIAEGSERGGNKEFRHFLYIGKASCALALNSDPNFTGHSISII